MESYFKNSDIFIYWTLISVLLCHPINISQFLIGLLEGGK